MAALDLSVISSAGLVLVSGYAALLRYTLKREREALELAIKNEADASKGAYNGASARINTVDQDARAEARRLQAALDLAGNRIVDLEKNEIRLEGEVKLLRQAHDGITRDLDEIKRQQVPRAEWERQMATVERTLAMILERLDSHEQFAKASTAG